MRGKVMLVALGLVMGEVVEMPDAKACGDEARPVVIDRPVSDSASQLFQQASLLEAQAVRADTRAVASDRRADQQMIEARSLRIEAASTEGQARLRLFALADNLTAQGASARAEARQMRDQAAELRAQARATRERASRLAGNGRWRQRPRPVAMESTFL